MGLLIRHLAPGDLPAVRELATSQIGTMPFAEGLLETKDALASDGDSEIRALVAEHGGRIAGVVLFGMVAGSQGTAKLHLVITARTSRRAGMASRLCDAAVEELVGLGARLVVAEIPDHTAFAPGRALLERCGWREEARVPDFCADGVALALMRRETRRSEER